jgi:ring-1,2-phenylacetyl-CoA epoxidase subunit PaaA
MLEKDAQRTSYPQDWLNGVLSWPQRAITSYLAERGALDIVEEMAESSYLPWAAIMPEIIEDESRHVEHGRRTTAELCRTEDGRRQVQAELDTLWPQVLDMFGRSESARSALAVKWGIRRRTNEQARQHFIDRVTPLLRELGLEPPDNVARRKFA